MWIVSGASRVEAVECPFRGSDACQIGRLQACEHSFTAQDSVDSSRPAQPGLLPQAAKKLSSWLTEVATPHQFPLLIDFSTRKELSSMQPYAAAGCPLDNAPGDLILDGLMILDPRTAHCRAERFLDVPQNTPHCALLSHALIPRRPWPTRVTMPLVYWKSGQSGQNLHVF